MINWTRCEAASKEPFGSGDRTLIDVGGDIERKAAAGRDELSLNKRVEKKEASRVQRFWTHPQGKRGSLTGINTFGTGRGALKEGTGV